MNSKNGFSLIMALPFLLNVCFCQAYLSQDIEALGKQLRTVNANWSEERFAMLGPDETYRFTNSRELIQLHLKLVEGILRASEKPGLSTGQQKKREYCLDQLNSYWQRGLFPINTYHSTPQPYFVDLYGTHCAVGFLLYKSGEATALINDIREKHNYAFIAELVEMYPQLGQWAAENGFTVDELAWIQPNYPPPAQEMHPLGNGGGANGPVYVMKPAPDGSLLYLAGDFTEMDGIPANSIIAWDGQEWSTLGMGINGKIYDMHFHNGKLHVAGNFKISGEEVYSSIAYWDNGQWVPLQEGYTGDVYAMETYQGKLYIGGGFQYLDGAEMPFLAYYDEEGGCWSNSSIVLDNGYLISISDIFSVDDTVRCFAVHDNLLFVGGDFSLTSPNASHPNVIHYAVNNLARWLGYIWLPCTGADFEYVNELELIGGQLYLMGPMNSMYGFFLRSYDNGIIEPVPTYSGIFENDKPPLAYGYIRHDGYDYFYGNIKPSTGAPTGGFYSHTGNRDGEFDHLIRAAAVFQGNIYFAGDFTKAFGLPFNGLAYSLWGANPISSSEPKEDQRIGFYVTGKQLVITPGQFIPRSMMNIYNASGQLVRSLALPEDSAGATISLSALHSGVYVFQFVGPYYQEAKTFALF
ncbi:MAG: T9SS type A sorting domain-containing protein [Phaeodactylibacter sp.]|nr:T9SS type A sorting domain-containing protein [Phaeodactylibacter sp.]MCB9274686.1 T9SS type A sorting domain-containing protein [Lewinellaceae bacterium]